jgi:hypothetical protein
LNKQVFCGCIPRFRAYYLDLTPPGKGGVRFLSGALLKHPAARIERAFF